MNSPIPDTETLNRLDEWARMGFDAHGITAAEAHLLAADEAVANRILKTPSHAFRIGVTFAHAHPSRRASPTPEERRMVAGRIDPETAEVTLEWGPAIDPDRTRGFADELGPIECTFLAIDPVERVPVEFGDLDDEQRQALEIKRAEAAGQSRTTLAEAEAILNTDASVAFSTLVSHTIQSLRRRSSTTRGARTFANQCGSTRARSTRLSAGAAPNSRAVLPRHSPVSHSRYGRGQPANAGSHGPIDRHDAAA